MFEKEQVDSSDTEGIDRIREFCVRAEGICHRTSSPLGISSLLKRANKVGQQARDGKI